MDTKRLVTGTIAGGIALFVLGYLIFDMAFAEFYVANAGSATGVMRESQLVWAVVLGSLSYGALITMMLDSRASSNIGTGTVVGALVGFLVWFTVDFTWYGVSNVANLARTVVDPLLEGVRGGIAGAVVAAALGRTSVVARQQVAVK